MLITIVWNQLTVIKTQELDMVQRLLGKLVPARKMCAYDYFLLAEIECSYGRSTLSKYLEGMP